LFDQFGGHAVILLPQTPVLKLVLVFHDYRFFFFFFFFFFLFVWSVNNATEKSRQIMKKQKTKPLGVKIAEKRKKEQKIQISFQHNTNNKLSSTSSSY
jgi:hypothetical protein